MKVNQIHHNWGTEAMLQHAIEKLTDTNETLMVFFDADGGIELLSSHMSIERAFFLLEAAKIKLALKTFGVTL